MRSIVELLIIFAHRMSLLSLDGDALKCSAPQGVLTPELRKELGRKTGNYCISACVTGGLHVPANSESHALIVPDLLPLSFGQQRLWFLNQLDSNSSVYNIGAALRMEGPLNIGALERSLSEIVLRHEDLRTSFIQVRWRATGCNRMTEEAGRCRSSMLAIFGRWANVSDFGNLPLSLIREVFDIARGPLFRAQLLIVGPEEHVLVLTVHHMVSDGWSMGVLMREFAELYQAYATGKELSLPPLTIQYVDFAAWQRKWLESGELDRQLPYWKTQLAGAPPVFGFPADHRRPPTEMFEEPIETGSAGTLVERLKHLSHGAASPCL